MKDKSHWCTGLSVKHKISSPEANTIPDTLILLSIYLLYNMDHIVLNSVVLVGCPENTVPLITNHNPEEELTTPFKDVSASIIVA